MTQGKQATRRLAGVPGWWFSVILAAAPACSTIPSHWPTRWGRRRGTSDITVMFPIPRCSISAPNWHPCSVCVVAKADLFDTSPGSLVLRMIHRRGGCKTVRNAIRVRLGRRASRWRSLPAAVASRCMRWLRTPGSSSTPSQTCERIQSSDDDHSSIVDPSMRVDSSPVNGYVQPQPLNLKPITLHTGCKVVVISALQHILYAIEGKCVNSRSEIERCLPTQVRHAQCICCCPNIEST